MDQLTVLSSALDRIFAEPESVKHQREQLRDTYFRAHEVREFKEASLRNHFSAMEMDLIRDFADAFAKEVMARRKLESMGFEP